MYQAVSVTMFSSEQNTAANYVEAMRIRLLSMSITSFRGLRVARTT
jgi:hypothetical protein